jgi:HSP20 family molecular chaperone IbpA
VITAELPEVEKDDVKVTMENGVLTRAYASKSE